MKAVGAGVIFIPKDRQQVNIGSSLNEWQEVILSVTR